MANDNSLDLIARLLGEMTSRLREMGDQSTEKIHGFYKEARRLVMAFDDRKGLGLRPAAVSITAATATAGTTSVTNTFKVADNEDFLIYEMRGYLSLNDMPNEPAVAAALGTNIGPSERLLLKASNTKINLINNDSKIPITDQADIVLAAILPHIGGMPLLFGGPDRPAAIVPHGQTLKMTATFGSTVAASIGASSDYGVILSGVYMTRPSRNR